MKNFKVGILGATGAVGQKFITLLHNHSWFEVKALGASQRSANQSYHEAVHWIEAADIPESISNIKVKPCEPGQFKDIDFVFSGLDSSVAGQIEHDFAQAGIPIISNAKNYRMDKTVPLLIPEVNPEHTSLIETQNFTDDGSGWIVTNPNCVCMPLAMSLSPLHKAFGIESVAVTSMQAISGGGYPGVASLDILGNIVPYIGGEEDKIVSEPQKMLGTLQNKTIAPANFKVETTAVRVPINDGHLLSVSANLENTPDNFNEIAEAFEQWENPISELNLPSSPKHTFKIYEENRFPQPRLHIHNEGGMQVSVGRLREGSLFDLSYLALAHNTIRGAAGGAILDAELLVKKEYLK